MLIGRRKRRIDRKRSLEKTVKRITDFIPPGKLEEMFAMAEFNSFLDNLGCIEMSRLTNEIEARGRAIAGEISSYKAERIVEELKIFRDYQISQLRKSMPHIGIIKLPGSGQEGRISKVDEPGKEEYTANQSPGSYYQT